jgi:hypothetical protein
LTGSRRTIRPKVNLIQQCNWNKFKSDEKYDENFFLYI